MQVREQYEHLRETLKTLPREILEDYAAAHAMLTAALGEKLGTMAIGVRTARFADDAEMARLTAVTQEVQDKFNQRIEEQN